MSLLPVSRGAKLTRHRCDSLNSAFGNAAQKNRPTGQRRLHQTPVSSSTAQQGSAHWRASPAQPCFPERQPGDRMQIRPTRVFRSWRTHVLTFTSTPRRCVRAKNKEEAPKTSRTAIVAAHRWPATGKYNQRTQFHKYFCVILFVATDEG